MHHMCIHTHTHTGGFNIAYFLYHPQYTPVSYRYAHTHTHTYDMHTSMHMITFINTHTHRFPIATTP
jgi:hypothetical protein